MRSVINTLTRPHHQDPPLSFYGRGLVGVFTVWAAIIGVFALTMGGATAKVMPATPSPHSIHVQHVCHTGRRLTVPPRIRWELGIPAGVHAVMCVGDTAFVVAYLPSGPVSFDTDAWSS